MKRYRKFKRRTARDIRRPGKAHGLDWRAAAWRASRPGKRGEHALEVLQDMFMQYYPREFQVQVDNAKRWGDRGVVSLSIRMMKASSPADALHFGPPGSDDLVLWSNRRLAPRNPIHTTKVEFQTRLENSQRAREPKAEGYGWIKKQGSETLWSNGSVRSNDVYKFIGWRRFRMRLAFGVLPQRAGNPIELYAVWKRVSKGESKSQGWRAWTKPKGRTRFFAQVAEDRIHPDRWPRLRWAKPKDLR